jgi:hypothetical protein
MDVESVVKGISNREQCKKYLQSLAMQSLQKCAGYIPNTTSEPIYPVRLKFKSSNSSNPNWVCCFVHYHGKDQQLVTRFFRDIGCDDMIDDHIPF